MANTIKIKRSNDATSAPNLAQGELAYNEKSDTQTLYYGNMSDSTIVVGGKKFMDMLDHSVGTLTASSAMLVDGNSKINSIKSGTMTITGTSETFDFGAAGDITIADNLGAALEIKEGSNEYMTFTTTDNGEQVKVFKSFKLNSGVGVDRILDENNMATDSDTALATQQSIKKYVDDRTPQGPGGGQLTVSADSGTNQLIDFISRDFCHFLNNHPTHGMTK